MSTSVINTIEQKMQEFLKCIRCANHMYEKIFKLCQEERRIIDAREFEKLMSVLGDKQQILNDVASVEGVIIALREEWQVFKDSSGCGLTEEISVALKAFGDLMEHLVAVQKENERLLYEATANKGEELRTVREKKRLHQVYASQHMAGPQTKYMDKRQ